MKILFTTGSMAGGGTERVISTLSNEFVKRDFDVDILVVAGDSVYPLDKKIKILKIFQTNEITQKIINKIYRRLVFHWRVFKTVKNSKPSYIITPHGGGWNLLFIVIGHILRFKVIASEHISHDAFKPSLFRTLERRFFYKFAAAITVLTRHDLSYYQNYVNKVVLIPNPLGIKPIDFSNQRSKTIIAAGRLNNWFHKGFDNLLYTFRKVHSIHPDWTLKIAGQGDAGMVYLKKLAGDLGILQKVEFLGFFPNIDELMRDSSIFVLSSRFEGFGMVLLEAMSQGCACVSFDCKAGPAEIIEDKVSGILIPNQDSTEMCKAICDLIVNPKKRLSISNAGVKRSRDFDPSSIVEKWICLFNEIAN